MRHATIGRFRVVREIGRGAMGRVLLAHDSLIDRQVAIKTLQITGALPETERAETLERFMREARAAGGLQHPNIVTIFDVGLEDGLPYIAMEYIEGERLDAFTRAPRLLPRERVLDIGIQAAEALDYAHARGLVHRDIKPANMILVNGRTLKIMDFGLAKKPEASVTSDGTILGTPNYMAPEQITGEALDGRTDLFSLGVVLYELLAGRRPFQGETISSVIHRILNDTPMPLHEVDRSIPRELSVVISRLLDRSRENRLARGSDLAAALRGVLDGIGRVPPRRSRRATDVVNPAALHSKRPATERRRPPGALIAIVGSVIAVLAIVAFLASQRLTGGNGGAARGAAGGNGEPQRTESGSAAPKEPEGAGPDAVEAAGTGGIRPILVVTEPPGGHLFVGGVPLDSDMLRLDPAGGPRQVRAVLGCRSAETTVDPLMASGNLTLPLKPGPVVEAAVQTDPPGASVTLDGRRLPETTPTRVPVDPCKGGTITLDLDGYRPRVVEIPADLDPEAVSAMLSSLDLEQLPDGRIVIEKQAYPLEVRLGSDRLGKAGDELTLPAGTKKLTLVNDNLFLSATLDVSVVPEKTVRVDPGIPTPGTLSVQAYPSNCRVYAKRKGSGGERFLDVVPILDRPLAPGEYTLTAEYVPTGEKQQKNVVIRPGQRIVVPFRFGT